jgi:hypothetical protein
MNLLGSEARQMSGSESWVRPATSIWGGHRMVIRKIGNPIVEKGMHTRSQQQLSGGMAASATQNRKGECDVGGRVRMPLSDARRNLFR